MKPLRHFPLRLVAAVVLLNLLLLVFAGFTALRDGEEHERRARATVRNLAMLAERDLSAVFDRVSLILNLVVEDLDASGSSGREASWELQRLLAHRHRQLPDVAGLWISDASGQVWAGYSQASTVYGAVADAEFLTRHRNDSGAGLIFVVVPARDGRAERLSISRRLERRQGGFGGAVFAELPLSFIADQFSRFDVGPAGSVEFRLIEPDRPQHPVLGEDGDLSRVRPGMDRAQIREGTYVFRSPTEGLERLYGYYRSASYPFQVEVSHSVDQFLDEWRHHALATMVGAILFVPVSLLFARLIWRGWRTQVQTAQALQESEERLRFAMDGAGYCLWEWDLSSGRFAVSPRGKEMLGLADGKIEDEVGAWAQRVHPDDRPLVRAELRRYLRGQRFESPQEIRLRHGAGHWIWVLMRAMVTNRDAQGRATRMIGTLVDITERHERMEALRLAASAYALSDEGVIVTNSRNEIISVNPAFTAVTGYALEDVVGRNPSVLSAKTYPKTFYQTMWKSLNETGSWHGEVVNRKKSGEVYIQKLTIKCIFDDKGKLTHFLGVLSDVTAKRQVEERMQHLALHDALTDLPNRLLLSERIGQALRQAQRDRTQLALVYFDLDKFKPVNDEHGHAVGDLLLQSVAARVRDCLRATDTLARLGGDEFVVLLAGLEDERYALTVAGKIRSVLEQPFPIQEHVFHISCSMGVVIHPQHGTREAVLLQHADEAMYEAKRAGGNRVVLYRGEQDGRDA